MTSGTDDEALRAQGKPGMEGFRDNVVTLAPKAKIRPAEWKRVTELPVPDRKADTPGRDGNDDPGPSAA